VKILVVKYLETLGNRNLVIEYVIAKLVIECLVSNIFWRL